MKVQPSVNHQPAQRIPLARTSEAPEQPKDGFSLTKTLAGGVLGFMGRRIPTTAPNISPEKSQELQAKIKPGDVLLTADLAFPGWARMEFWTVRSHYTHAAFVGSDNQVYEAVGGGVLKGSLDSFLEGRLKVAVLRPGISDEHVEKATDYCRQQLGKPYDGVFNTADDSEFYCSELVAKALAQGDSPLETPTSKLLGKVAYAPDAFRHIPNIEVVHDDGSHYWKNKVTQWPLAVTTVVGGVAGHLLSGYGGAAVGAAAGFVGSVLVGNKIQTGHFSPGLADLASSKNKNQAN